MRWLIAGLGLLTLTACGAPSATLTPASPPAIATPTDAETRARLDPRPLAADPAKYDGQPVSLYGKPAAVTHDGDTTRVRLLAQVVDRPGLTETVLLRLHPRREDVLRGECYLVVGHGRGMADTGGAQWGVPARTPVVDVDTLRAGTFC